jgi:hypothetical protein
VSSYDEKQSTFQYNFQTYKLNVGEIMKSTTIQRLQTVRSGSDSHGGINDLSLRNKMKTPVPAINRQIGIINPMPDFERSNSKNGSINKSPLGFKESNPNSKSYNNLNLPPSTGKVIKKLDLNQANTIRSGN